MKLLFTHLSHHRIVAIALIAILLSMPFHIIHAASLGNISDTLSDSRPSVGSNHTIAYTTTTAVAAGQTITVTFPAGFDVSTIVFGDVDLNINGVDQTLAAAPSGGTWGVGVSGQILTITSGTGTAGAGVPVIIKVGTNAVIGTTGTHQVANTSSSNASYVETVTSGPSDSSDLRIAIVDAVTVTASVDTSLTFTVAGVASGQAVNGDAVTTSSGATATALPFGTLTPGTAKTLGQTLSVTTNAQNGFAVTVVENQELTSSNGASIHLFKDDSKLATPAAWTSPLGTLGTVTTYGHYGITSEDSDLNAGEFSSSKYAGNIDVPRVIFSNSGPADGTTANKGQTRVAIKIQVSALQPAATDYTNRLTYVATPIF